MSTEPNKVIYSMVGVSKFYDKKPVLKDIYLSYFYGAKIGVIGLNGSGKSSLLRILAGVDKDFNGETVISPGFTVGYLEQEPLIDDARTVREVVEEAVQETVNLLKEFEEINAKFGEEMSDDEMSALLERQGEVQEKLDASGRLGSRFASRDGDGRAALPAAGHAGESSVRRRTPPRRAVPSAAAKARHPAARRADQPSRRGISRVARTSPAELSRARSSPSRTIAIFSTTSPAGFSNSIAARAFRGKETTLRGSNRNRSVCAAKKSPKANDRKRCNASSNGFACRRKRVTRKAKRESTPTKNCCAGITRSAAKISRSTFRPGHGSATSLSKRTGVNKGYGENLLVEDMTFALPPGGIVGVIGPNGAGKTTLFRMITGQEQPDSGNDSQR